MSVSVSTNTTEDVLRSPKTDPVVSSLQMQKPRLELHQHRLHPKMWKSGNKHVIWPVLYKCNTYVWTYMCRNIYPGCLTSVSSVASKMPDGIAEKSFVSLIINIQMFILVNLWMRTCCFSQVLYKSFLVTLWHLLMVELCVFSLSYGLHSHGRQFILAVLSCSVTSEEHVGWVWV